MFSGQGSQYFHMGKELYGRDAHFRKNLDELFLILSDFLEDPAGTLFDPAKKKSDSFSNLRETHPILFCVQVALGKTLLEYGFKPDLILGYSLGELVAETVAGHLAEAEALRLCIFQAEVIATTTEPAVMIAILESPGLVSAWPPFGGKPWACFNFPRHCVWTLPRGEVNAAQAILKEKAVSHQVLPVEFGFHSPLILPAKNAVADEISRLNRSRSSFPVFSTSLGKTVANEWSTTSFEWDILERPVDFCTAVKALEAEGPWHYVDGGPSGTLANFVKYNLSKPASSRTSALMSPFGKEVEDLREWVKVSSGF